MALVVKNPLLNAGDMKPGLIPGSGRSPGGHSNPLQYSCLENPMDRAAWLAKARRVTQSQTWLKWLISLIDTAGFKRKMLSEYYTNAYEKFFPLSKYESIKQFCSEWLHLTYWNKNCINPTAHSYIYNIQERIEGLILISVARSFSLKTWWTDFFFFFLLDLSGPSYICPTWFCPTLCRVSICYRVFVTSLYY